MQLPLFSGLPSGVELTRINTNIEEFNYSVEMLGYLLVSACDGKRRHALCFTDIHFLFLTAFLHQKTRDDQSL
jgi:hypothetical protein